MVLKKFLNDDTKNVPKNSTIMVSKHLRKVPQ